MGFHNLLFWVDLREQARRWLVIGLFRGEGKDPGRPREGALGCAVGAGTLIPTLPLDQVRLHKHPHSPCRLVLVQMALKKAC